MSGSLADPVSRSAADWLRSRLRAGARLTADSRKVTRGDGFFGWPGAVVDGRQYCRAARAAGASAIVLEAADWRAQGQAEADTLMVADLRRRAGPIAADWLGQPSLRLTVVAVTGTNGKTSCTHWIATGANRRFVNERAVVVGTLGLGLPERLDDSAGLTTPDALSFQQALAGFAAADVALVSVEASSVGLSQHRLDGTSIAVAVMTNLSRDHLDLHGSMAAYAEAKARLFEWPGLQAAVVNLDDPVAAAMLDRLPAGVRRIGYSTAATPPGRNGLEVLITAAALPTEARSAVAAVPTPTGNAFFLTIGSERELVRLNLLGDFNRSNALAVAGAWHALGWSMAQIVVGLEQLRPVPGRLEFLGDAADCTSPLVVIDYAHTPAALSNVLATLMPLAAARGGRLWCVFGAGGNRDRGKRPEMSRAAAAQADYLVLTSDNPRHEPAAAILDDLRAGLKHEPHCIEADRARAIGHALAAAAAADVILIAGKGHERYQEIAGVRYPFSDLAVARAARASRGGGQPRSDR